MRRRHSRRSNPEENMRKTWLFAWVMVSLGAGGATLGLRKAHADSGPVSFNGQPLIPRWGVGTLLRANDATPVYVVDRSFQYRHILNPGWFQSCHRDPNTIIWVF